MPCYSIRWGSTSGFHLRTNAASQRLRRLASPSHPPGVSHRPPADLEALPQAGPPPVYIGFGSMRGADERGFTEQVVSALQRCGQRGILLTGWGAIAHVPLPETIFAIDAVPHDWLFPRVAAVVHHRGSGTPATGSPPRPH